jgi:DNA-binding MarR family transcriptional regulator
MVADVMPPKVGALLRMAWQQLHAELYERLRAEGFDDLREPHRALLRYPGIDGVRPSELAVTLGLSRQTVNDLLRDIEALGYARTEADPNDGRARIIRYTDRGWKLLHEGSRISEEIGERWAAAIGPDSYEAMLDALRRILRLDGSS